METEQVSTPQRIQLRRSYGWRKPEGVIVVARPSKWGNPFRYRTSEGLARVPAIDGSAWEYEGRISAAGTRHDCYHEDGRWTEHHVRYMTRAECVQLYERALLAPTQHMHLRSGGHPCDRGWLTAEDARRELAGRDLACWCPLDDGEGNHVPCHVDVLLRVSNSAPMTLTVSTEPGSAGQPPNIMQWPRHAPELWSDSLEDQ